MLLNLVANASTLKWLRLSLSERDGVSPGQVWWQAVVGAGVRGH